MLLIDIYDNYLRVYKREKEINDLSSLSFLKWGMEILKVREKIGGEGVFEGVDMKIIVHTNAIKANYWVGFIIGMMGL